MEIESMEDGSVLATLLAGAILLFLGSFTAFAGYQLFLILLPICGFFFGLAFGVDSSRCSSATASY
jgi:hypothetical protein